MDSSDRRLTPAALRSFQLTKYQVVNEKSKRDGLSPILAASANGHLDVVRCLVKNGANINDLNPEGQTPLILAAKNGYQPLLRLLVNYGAKMDIQDAKGRTALMHALTEGRLELARFLMGSGASQAPTDREGKTALFVAAECGHVAIVEHLLMEKSGADLAARDRQGRTVLMMLARAGKAWPVYKYISESKLAELINDRDSAGYTPLLHAAEAGKFSLGARLIKWGANVKAVTDDGRTVIMLACQRPLISCATADSDPVDFGATSDDTAVETWDQKSFVAAMMKLGVAIDAVDDKGRTVLFYAVEYAELQMLQHLLSKHAGILRVDGRDSAGNTILHAAARMGRESVVRYLTGLPALANLIDEPNAAAEMPVRLAIMSKSLPIVRSLVDCGASLDKANRCSETPLLCVACENGAEDIVTFLLDRGFNPDWADSEGVTPLMAATRSDHIRIVERLLKASASVNLISKKGFTALTLAVQTVNIAICKVLLNHKANPNLMPDGKSDCKTLCSIAATLDSSALLDLLVEFKADPFQKDSQGRNALYFSVLLNRISPLKMLVRWCDGKHAEDYYPYEGNRYTLLHIAAERCSVDAMKQLLNGQPSLDMKSNIGETPLHIACRRQHSTIVSMLSSYTSKPKLDTPRDSDQFTPLMIAGHVGHQIIALDLISKGADVNRRLPNGCTALILAVKGNETPIDRMPLISSLLHWGATFDSPIDRKLLGEKAYNLLATLDKARTGKAQSHASTQRKSEAAQTSPTAAQLKPKTSAPMTAEERLKAKLKKKQLHPPDQSKAVEGEAKTTESFAVRAKKARDEVQHTLDVSETSVKRISSMMKKYVEVTALPDPQQDESGDSLAKEMRKQDITHLYKRPFLLSYEQMQQNRLVCDFSKKMDLIRQQVVRKFEEKLDFMCSQKAKSAPKGGQPLKTLSKKSDSSESRDSAMEILPQKRPRRQHRVRWGILYQLKYERKSSKPGKSELRLSLVRRLRVLKTRWAKKRRRHRLPAFWETLRLHKIALRYLAPRMRWLIEATKLTDSDLVSKFSYVRLEGIAAGVQEAAVWWQPLPDPSEFEMTCATQKRRKKSSIDDWRSQIAQLTSASGHRCNLLVRCGRRPTEVKLFNDWRDSQMQLDLSCSLQPELFHVRKRLPRERRPDIVVRLTVDTRWCLWDSRELRVLADSLISAPTSAPAEAVTANELVHQRRMLECLIQRRTYQLLKAVGGIPQELDLTSQVTSLHPALSTKLMAVILHVGLARSVDAAYSVHGDDVLLYQQPAQKELKQLLGLLGRGRVKLIEARRFNN